MKSFDNLSKEQKLLILTSRLTFADEDKSKVKELVGAKIDWFEFFKIATYHKTTTLCWRNIKNIVPDVIIPKYLRQILRFISDGISKSNLVYFEEMESIQNKLKEAEIICVPVKGLMLIPQLYKDTSIRFMGDLDVLILKKDIQQLTKIMNQLGYIQGRFNLSSNDVTPISRSEEIMWKINMSNLFPFVKLNQDKDTLVKVDFRYSLDDTLETAAVTKIVETYQKRGGHYTPGHVLIHLCTHFYDEAHHSMTLERAKGFNLIKLCDIREYILNCMTTADLDEAVTFAHEYNCQRQLYYTMALLLQVYPDERCMDILGAGVKTAARWGETQNVVERLFFHNGG